MADEKKDLTLDDLGLDDTAPELPADKAEKLSETKVTDIKEVKTNQQPAGGNNPPIQSVTATVQDEEVKKHRNIPKPIRNPSGYTNDGSPKYKEVGDINKFLGRKPKERPNPVQETYNKLYDMADQGIERTKKDLLKPGGRIEEAKEKYILAAWPKLQERARNNKRLQEQINKMNHIMDNDARFDGISELERHGYIIHILTRRNTGVDDAYFGLEEAAKDDQSKTRPRFSADAQKEIDQIIEYGKDLEWDDLDEEDTVSLGRSNHSSSYDEIPDLENSASDNATRPDISKAKVEDDKITLQEDMRLLEPDKEDENEDAKEDPEEYISEEQTKQIQQEYKSQLIKELRLDRTDDLEGFVIDTKPIALNKALRPRNINQFTYLWPLTYTGIGVEMTPLKGDEIIQLNPANTDFETIKGLSTVFSILYHHIVNPNKAPFETWLRQISDYDIDSLIFGAHAATFKDSNYITYECPNPKCKKVFLQKKDIMDMVSFPNDESKQRFNDILAKDTIMKQTYKSTPKRISEDYAIGFVSQSIYSNLFEPASLSNEFSQKFASIIQVMPNIDKVYKIDNLNKKLIPIEFKMVQGSLSNTIEKRVRSLHSIFQTFNPDERALVIAEAQKISQQMDKWKINYGIPATTCPHCHTEVPKRESNPLNILFIRAQLPIVIAYLPE